MNLKKIINSNSRFSEIIRFGLVGALATVLQYGFYVVFVHVVGVKAVPSSMISYALSFIVNFFLSSYFTFHTRPNAKKRSWIHFEPSIQHGASNRTGGYFPTDCRNDTCSSSCYGNLHTGELPACEIRLHKQDFQWRSF